MEHPRGVLKLKIDAQQIKGLLQPAGPKAGLNEAKALKSRKPQGVAENATPPSEPEAGVRETDTIVFSAKAREVQLARKVAGATPDVRPEKVASLTQLIAEGRYDVPAENVAAAMLRPGKPKPPPK